MDILLIRGTQYVLCGVSMVLTCAFALSFASETNLVWPASMLPLSLMVLIGLGIDLSKYLFWRWRAQHRGFLALSLVLLAFSWSASMAFFITQEKHSINDARQKTTAYQSHIKAIDDLQSTLVIKQNLVRKRLSSQYHEQWDKGEALAQEVDGLSRRIAQLRQESEGVGITEAQAQVATSVFFQSLSVITGLSAVAIAAVSYAILALILELSALGMIALSANQGTRSDDQLITIQNDSQEKESQEEALEGDCFSSKQQQLRQDILDGLTVPTIRKITRSYSMQYNAVKPVLEQLLKEGRLIKVGKVYTLVNDRVLSKV